MVSPDTPPPADNDRIAALEAQVAELRDICANLHNSIQHSFNLMIATQKATVIGVMRANRDAAVDAELDSEGQGLNISMSKARRLIWGEAGNDKE